MASKTSRIGLNKYDVGERGWGPGLDANFDILDLIESVTGLVTTLAEDPSTTLRVKVASGSFRASDGSRVDYAGEVVTLPDDATSYLWLADDGTLDHDTAYPGTAHVPLSIVETADGVVTSIQLDRIAFPALGSVSSSTADANKVYAGPTTGSPATPTFRLLVAGDIPSLAASIITSGTLGVTRGGTGLSSITSGKMLYASASNTLAELTVGTGLSISGGTLNATGGSGTVTSVDLTAPGTIMTASGGPITSGGVLSLAAATVNQNYVMAGPSSGGSGAWGPRALVMADLPNAGVTPGSYSVPTMTVNAQGVITAISSGSGVGTGTVTSVGLSLPAIFSVSGSPVTTSGTLTGSLANQSANVVFSGPSSGGAAAPTFRALVAADIPDLDAAKITTGALAIANGGTGQTTANAALNALIPTQTSNSGKFLTTDGTNTSWGTPAGSGTVTSVGLSLPAIFSVSGSPVTGSGTLTGTLANQSANTFFAGPSTGAATTPTFRAIAAADLPNHSASLITSGTVGETVGGTGQSSYTTGDVLYASASNTLSKLAGNATTTRKFLRQTGTGSASQAPAWDTLVAGDVPNLAGSIITSGSVGPTVGGTGLTSYALGDVLYSSATNTLAALAGNTTTTKKFLRQTGNGSVSAAPAWDTLVAGDIPNLAGSIITSGSVGPTVGGTGLTSYTTGDTLYSSASNTLAKLAGNTTTTKKFMTQTGNGSASAAPAWGTIGTADVPVMVASGGSHAPGLVPDPPSSSGTTKFLREDATWAIPSGGGSSITSELVTCSGVSGVSTLSGGSVQLSVLTSQQNFWTINLPSSPSDGQIKTVKFADLTNKDVLISGNGAQIEGFSYLHFSTLSTSARGTVTFQYGAKPSSGSYWWIIHHDDINNPVLTSSLPPGY